MFYFFEIVFLFLQLVVLKDVFVVCDRNPDGTIGFVASFLYKND